MDTRLIDQLTTSDPTSGALRCGLCAHRCVLRVGQIGRCGAITNQTGRLHSLASGHPVVMHADPIERKPLYHVLPGAKLLSLGTRGCNMTCDFCQNWRISQTHPAHDGEMVPPAAVVSAALAQGCAGIAFTYNEPTIYLDYAAVIMAMAQQVGLITVFKSNGYLTPEAIELITSPPLLPLNEPSDEADVWLPRESLVLARPGHPRPISPSPPCGEEGTRRDGRTLPVERLQADVHGVCPPVTGARRMPSGSPALLDAINIDLKGFDDSYYRNVCGARLQPVLDAITQLHRRGVWVEVTTLLIPGVNDSDNELRALTQWLVALSPAIPWHVWRFHPDYRMTDVAWTHVRDVERAIAIGRAAGLHYVYASNLPGDPNQHTRCGSCGATLIERVGNVTERMRMDGGKCGECGVVLPGWWG